MEGPFFRKTFFPKKFGAFGRFSGCKWGVFFLNSFLTNSVNFDQLRNYDIDISNKRYSNSSNKNNLNLNKEKIQEIEKLNNIYSTKEREYNNLVIQYKEILDSLNQKKDFLNKNKIKYQSLTINNNNMKKMLLKLMKNKIEKILS